MDRLPRRCPVCGHDTIIGHGRRLRNAHDDRRQRLWIRRGLCRQCNKTFTILPDGLVPFGHYSLRCRQQACEQIASGDSAERATPCCQDPERIPDSSSVRRWARRRLFSACCWLKTVAAGEIFLPLPTILAWDFDVFCRMLSLKAKSP